MNLSSMNSVYSIFSKMDNPVGRNVYSNENAQIQKIYFKWKIIKWQIIFQNCVPMILLDLTQQWKRQGLDVCYIQTLSDGFTLQNRYHDKYRCKTVNKSPERSFVRRGSRSGATSRTWTGGLLIMNQLLYQLSHSSIRKKVYTFFSYLTFGN